MTSSRNTTFLPVYRECHSGGGGGEIVMQVAQCLVIVHLCISSVVNFDVDQGYKNQVVPR
jgi:hypothetical protein